jgi:hypothetical protein
VPLKQVANGVSAVEFNPNTRWKLHVRLNGSVAAVADLPASEGHMASKAFVRFYISVWTAARQFGLRRMNDGVGGDVRVRICRSRCSSLVKDWPQ